MTYILLGCLCWFHIDKFNGAFINFWHACRTSILTLFPNSPWIYPILSVWGCKNQLMATGCGSLCYIFEWFFLRFLQLWNQLMLWGSLAGCGGREIVTCARLPSSQQSFSCSGNISSQGIMHLSWERHWPKGLLRAQITFPVFCRDIAPKCWKVLNTMQHKTYDVRVN